MLGEKASDRKQLERIGSGFLERVAARAKEGVFQIMFYSVDSFGNN